MELSTIFWSSVAADLLLLHTTRAACSVVGFFQRIRDIVHATLVAGYKQERLSYYLCLCWFMEGAVCVCAARI